jgi:hypothetical protein
MNLEAHNSRILMVNRVFEEEMPRGSRSANVPAVSEFRNLVSSLDFQSCTVGSFVRVFSDIFGGRERHDTLDVYVSVELFFRALKSTKHEEK